MSQLVVGGVVVAGDDREVTWERLPGDDRDYLGMTERLPGVRGYQGLPGYQGMTERLPGGERVPGVTRGYRVTRGERLPGVTESG